MSASYTGTDASETLWKIWNNEWTSFGMLGGNDTVVAPGSSTKNYLMSGGDGNDWLQGSRGKDVLFGGNHDDTLFGMGNDDTLDAGKGWDELQGGTGNDTLYGGANGDVLYGEDGNDRMVGGSGHDWMWGGNGRDTYSFSLGDSWANTDPNFGADIIHNWNGEYDKISMRDGSYREYNAKVNLLFIDNIDIARGIVENNSNLVSKDHVFVYGGKNGYLLSDLDGDGSFETGVVLENRGHASDFGSGNLV